MRTPLLERSILVVAPELDAASAWRMMKHQEVRHVLVMRGSKLVGVVSDRDLLAHGTWRHGKLELDSSLLIVHLMSPAPYTCRPNAKITDVAKVMIGKQVDCIPVLDEHERVVGLVTSTDLVSLAAERTSEDVLPFAYRIRDLALKE